MTIDQSTVISTIKPYSHEAFTRLTLKKAKGNIFTESVLAVNRSSSHTPIHFIFDSEYERSCGVSEDLLIKVVNYNQKNFHSN